MWNDALKAAAPMARQHPFQLAVVTLSLFGALAGGLSAAPKRSLSESEIESAEARATLDKSIESNQKLREKLALSEAAAAKLSESVALANSEAEVFRRQTAELKLRLEALGVDGAEGSSTKLEQRLLKAVSDLRIAEEERKKLSDALGGLSESALRFVKTASNSDADTRLSLEGQLRHSNEVLGGTPEGTQEGVGVNATLTEGMVMAYKDELALVVANLGARQGVKVGMPFEVIRDEKVIATIRIVDVRQKIAGALIQNLNSEGERIQVGDRLKIAALQ